MAGSVGGGLARSLARSRPRTAGKVAPEGKVQVGEWRACLNRELVWKNYVIRTSIVRFVSSKGIENLLDSERKEFFRSFRENVVWYRKFRSRELWV